MLPAGRRGAGHLRGCVDPLAAIDADAEPLDDGLQLSRGEQPEHLLETEGTGTVARRLHAGAGAGHETGYS